MALSGIAATIQDMALAPRDALTVARMRKAGIRNPVYTLLAARKTGLPLTLACAFLDQETGGGRNCWGHDGTIFVGGYDAKHHVQYGPDVTQAGYTAYKAQRGPTGAGGMQGVGPCQLTYWSYQDAADRLGGCWKPYPNLKVGFGVAAGNVRRYGLHPGVAAYNGSGPAANRYADSVLAREKVWAARLKQKSVQG